MQLNLNNIKQVLRTIVVTENEEFNCEDCYQQIEQFVELNIRGESPDKAMSLVENHLKICNDCREEYEVLKSAIQKVNQS